MSTNSKAESLPEFLQPLAVALNHFAHVAAEVEKKAKKSSAKKSTKPKTSKTKTVLDLANEYSMHAKKKKDLELKIDIEKRHLLRLESALLPQMLEGQVLSLQTKAGSVHVRHDVYASLRDKQIGIELLEKYGYSDLVIPSVSSNSLSAWVRELIKAGSERDGAHGVSLSDCIDLPSDLKDQIAISEKISLRLAAR
jgi:hypothetical protein